MWVKCCLSGLLLPVLTTYWPRLNPRKLVTPLLLSAFGICLAANALPKKMDEVVEETQQRLAASLCTVLRAFG